MKVCREAKPSQRALSFVASTQLCAHRVLLPAGPCVHNALSHDRSDYSCWSRTISAAHEASSAEASLDSTKSSLPHARMQRYPVLNSAIDSTSHQMMQSITPKHIYKAHTTPTHRDTGFETASMGSLASECAEAPICCTSTPRATTGAAALQQAPGRQPQKTCRWPAACCKKQRKLQQQSAMNA